MPELKICLNDPELKLSKKDKEAVMALRDQYKDFNPKEADRRTLADYHKSLHDELNNLKDAVGIDADTYAPVDNSERIAEINQRYDKALTQEDKQTREESTRLRQQREQDRKEKAAAKKLQDIQDAKSAKIYRESAARLRESGDIEGAKLLDQRAEALEGEKNLAAIEAKDIREKSIETLEKKQEKEGLSEVEEKKLDADKTGVALIEKFKMSPEEIIADMKKRGVLISKCD